MEMPYTPETVERTGQHFDAVVGKIQAWDFRVQQVPERKVYKECDLRSFCAVDRLIKEFAEEP